VDGREQAAGHRYTIRESRRDVSDYSIGLSFLSLNKCGRFRWVYCLLDILRRCFPASIPSILEHLPETLDETYEHILRRIDKVKGKFAHRLLQCLAVSFRPLLVEELGAILALRFDAGALPQFNTGWQLGDAEEAVLSACSTLITVTHVNGSRIVQFAHSSVREFLASDRLASASEDLSHYHIILHQAHTTLAKACLGVLLKLDDRIDRGSIKAVPLANYAAQHWFEHNQFENVSLTIRDATIRLFDPERPHFAAWIWIYDLDDPWREPMPTNHPERPEAPPLYYAIHCRLRWLIEHLIATYPNDIDARGGYHHSSWIAAFHIGFFDIAWSLLRSGADVNALDNGGANPLHYAAEVGRADLVRSLLEHNVDVDLPTSRSHLTALGLASFVGSVEVSRLLIRHGADVNSRTRNDWTPLNRASKQGHLNLVRFLIENHADVDSPNHEGVTPLHSAASKGHLDIVKVLIESGADFIRRNDDSKTPLDLAFDNGELDVANFLSGHMAGEMSPAGMVKSSTSILRPRHNPPILLFSHYGNLEKRRKAPTASSPRSTLRQNMDG
jgi:hypothetical protein